MKLPSDKDAAGIQRDKRRDWRRKPVQSDVQPGVLPQFLLGDIGQWLDDKVDSFIDKWL